MSDRASSPPEYGFRVLDTSGLESEPVEIEILENDELPRFEDLTEAQRRRRERREVARFNPAAFLPYSRRPAVARPTIWSLPRAPARFLSHERITPNPIEPITGSIPRL
jgi:hypothetical protein